MIPSAVAHQLQRGLEDFLRFSFWSSTAGMERVLEDFLATPNALFRGPYVSVELPFRKGGDPRHFPEVPLGFPPHLHQAKAFERLGGRRKRSTLIASGTGSGKTESFLLPILDHCRAEAGEPGVKAILIYPMNALATDQAGRIARLVHGNDRLRGRVTAGLYVGESRGGTVGRAGMGADMVITDRATMWTRPPDVLLTNYKMLDLLLLRPQDQQIWSQNRRGTLRFLVVDEIHTFDGAQGTDLACLLRRLKRRLQVDDGSLCCVGTSATLGGAAAAAELREYAGRVFGEPFDEGSVIGESRLGAAELLDGCELDWTAEPGPGDEERLDPAGAEDPEAWLAAQVDLWLGEAGTAALASGGDERWVKLGERLKRHAAFQGLLHAVGGGPVPVERLVEAMGRQRSDWREDPALARLALGSLLALASRARSWRPELPEVAARREAEGRPRPLRPFVGVRVQLWQRELTRMVGTVGRRPRLRHWSDLDREARAHHLPMIHCRECGALGWAALVQRDRPYLYRTELDAFYPAYFRNDPRIAYLYPAASRPAGDATWAQRVVELEVDTLTRVDPARRPAGETIELVAAPNTRSHPDGARLSRDCPFCNSRQSLALVGFRAATLTSVYVDQLFATPFNDDKKLLAFSDSVQDAAHRAGFFAARTWRTNLRIAIVQAIRQRGDLGLGELARGLGRWWRDRLGDDATWIATFLAPNMAWLHDWDALQRDGVLPAGSDLPQLVGQRLAFEVVSDFGLQAGIGRSLPRTGSAAAGLDRGRLETTVSRLVEPLRNEVPGLRRVTPDEIRRFVVGLLHHLRLQGGYLAHLPDEYVASVGHNTYAFQRTQHLPSFGKTSRLPILLTDRTRRRFDTWAGKEGTSWYARWADRCFGAGEALRADAASLYPVLLPSLVKDGLLGEVVGNKGERVWGLEEDAFVVTPQVAEARCEHCGHRIQIAAWERELWEGLPCVSARCAGNHRVSELAGDYFGRLYASGDLQRIFAEEHTGLLERDERERVERQFQAPESGPEARKPWYPNLLSCTPTLEMGIDIGDLSSAILCSVPPGQANYLQRIGRAGRRDGNAFLLTVAASRAHDLYFFAEPAEMIAGEVRPPGVFLDAPAVLERQLTAFCFDRWVAEHGTAVDLPLTLQPVLARLQGGERSDRFPWNLLDFVDRERHRLLGELLEMFAGQLAPTTRQHLRRFLGGMASAPRAPEADGTATLEWRLLEILHREREQRDSLAAKARSLRDEIRRLRQTEAQPLDVEKRLGELEDEKNALQRLVADVNKRRTLELLTDEGMLPNYAFPEAAVRLSSVIWRQRKEASNGRRRYDTWSYDYRRSPATALSEFAPGADFYASGRHVQINRVDVSVSPPETWRFCPECSHGARIDRGDEARECPACGSGGWKDSGQRFRLLKLRQVFANAPDRDSRIRDESDDRKPSFFERQILVDVEPGRRSRRAWRAGGDDLPFGFELLERATFRDLNFGVPSEQGRKSTIAGREAVRPGFEVCAICGTVQRAEAQGAEHSLACPARQEDVETPIEPCLYLYRELTSEALRVLLPLTELGSSRQLHSFMAALQLGLQELFGGSVDHLRSTVYSEPVPGSVLRRQFLVLYDTVPGGTGYLAQLVEPAGDGQMPLFTAMERALARIEGCRCWSDPERDGCYRCLYAYRNSRDIDDTSAKAAADLLRRILAGKGSVETVDGLSSISVSGLLGSVLEARFLEALSRIEGDDGRRAAITRAVVRGKPGYRWTLGEAEWIIEPQVEPPAAETAGLRVSIDFELRPARAGDDRRLAVFLDGWEYHRARIGLDLAQRMALGASGRWHVWSLTWDDLETSPRQNDAGDRLELAVPDRAALREWLQRVGLARAARVLERPLFDWLRTELCEGLPWREIGGAVLAARMRHAGPADVTTWGQMATRSAPPAVRSVLAAIDPKLVATDLAELHPLVELMAVHDGADPALLVRLDDGEEHDEGALRWAWTRMLRLFQLLSPLANSWFVTTKGLAAAGLYEGIVAVRDATGGAPPVDATWICRGEIAERYLPLADRLAAAGVREPAVGLELPDRRGDTWCEAELAWEPEKVAITSREAADDALGSPAEGWHVFYLEDVAEEAGPLLAALGKEA